MSNSICPRCGTSYAGWQCPTCAATDRVRRATEELGNQVAESVAASAEAQRESAERLAERMAEEQEATRQAYQEAADRMEQATAEAAKEHRQAIADSWKLQARAKSDRAFELYKASLYQEATALAKQAIAEDPGNLTAYKAAAWSLEALGDLAAARGYFEKQLGVLVTADYCESPEAFRAVLDGLPKDDAALQELARKTARQLVKTWHLGLDTHLGLLILTYRGWREEVGLLVARLVEKPFATSPFAVLELLREKGFLQEAHELARSVARAKPSLETHAWAMDLSGEEQSQERKAFESWVTTVPAKDRGDLRRGLEALAGAKNSRISKETLAVFRTALAERRRAWEPEIARELSGAAAKMSIDEERRRKAWNKHYYMGGPVAQGCGLTALGFLPLGLVAALGGGKLALALFQVWMLAVVAVAFVSGFVLNEKVQRALFKECYEAAWEAENKAWWEVLKSE